VIQQHEINQVYINVFDIGTKKKEKKKQVSMKVQKTAKWKMSSYVLSRHNITTKKRT